MNISSRKFGKYDNKAIKEYILDNGNKLNVKIISLGATIREINYKDINTVLGFNNVEDYVNSRTYFGALVGRVAGRVSNGEVLISNKKYKLDQNEGSTCLHGGDEGYSFKVWEYVDSIVKKDSVSIILGYTSPDFESGFPGELINHVKYTVYKNDSLSIEYFAKSTKDTPITLTNHSYFNLNGDLSTDILNHILYIDADKYMQLDENNIPITISNVGQTPFDFRSGKAVNKDQIILSSAKTGIQLKINTSEPVVILYCSNKLEEGLTLSNGDRTIRYQGVCLETQWYPDAINQEFLLDNILKAGEEYNSKTVYKFHQI